VTKRRTEPGPPGMTWHMYGDRGLLLSDGADPRRAERWYAKQEQAEQRQSEPSYVLEPAAPQVQDPFADIRAFIARQPCMCPSCTAGRTEVLVERKPLDLPVLTVGKAGDA